MENKERLLELRKNLNKERPSFIRREYYRRSKLRKTGWRKPKGIHNKMRERRIGKSKIVEIGYRGPAATRGLTREGKSIIMVKSLSDMLKFNPDEEAAIIARTLGKKKKYEIVKEAVKMNATFLNLKNTKKFLTDVEMGFKAKKEEKQGKPEDLHGPAAEAVRKIPEEEKKAKRKIPEGTKSGAVEYAKRAYEKTKQKLKTEKTPTAQELAEAKDKAKAAGA